VAALWVVNESSSTIAKTSPTTRITAEDRFVVPVTVTSHNGKTYLWLRPRSLFL